MSDQPTSRPPTPHDMPKSPPAWVTDLSPYPAPEDYEPKTSRLVHVSLSDVPWDGKTSTTER